MAAKNSVLGPTMSYPLYLRSAQGRFPFRIETIQNAKVEGQNYFMCHTTSGDARSSTPDHPRRSPPCGSQSLAGTPETTFRHSVVLCSWELRRPYDNPLSAGIIA